MKTYQLIATFTLLASLQSFAGVQKNCLDDKQVATARLLDLSGAIKIQIDNKSSESATGQIVTSELAPQELTYFTNEMAKLGLSQISNIYGTYDAYVVITRDNECNLTAMLVDDEGSIKKAELLDFKKTMLKLKFNVEGKEVRTVTISK